jgi:arginyl-tRNA--protein-N-Asp/Glu arginylyltransferase
LVSATFEPEKYDWALDNGWCPSNIWYNQDTNFKKENEIIWYQSRQSRINLATYEESKTERKLRRRLNEVKIEFTQNPNLNSLYKIYHSYVKQKGYEDRMNQDEFVDSYGSKNEWFILFDNAAFTVMEVCGSSLLSHQFCWDYAKPELYLGKYSTYLEIEFAAKNNLKHVYLGPSYEKHSSYKSDYKGFEFWTGRQWCSNKQLYQQLLEHDGQITQICDITNAYDQYFDLFDI